MEVTSQSTTPRLQKAVSTGRLNQIGRNLFRRRDLKRWQSDSVLNSVVMPECAFIAMPSASPPRQKLTRLKAALLRTSFLGRVVAIPAPPHDHQHAKDIDDECEASEQLLSATDPEVVDGVSDIRVSADVHSPSLEYINRLSPIGEHLTPRAATSTKNMAPQHTGTQDDGFHIQLEASAENLQYSHKRQAANLEEDLEKQIVEYKSLCQPMTVESHNDQAAAVRKQLDVYEKTQRKQDELIHTLRLRCRNLEIERDGLASKNITLNAKKQALENINRHLSEESGIEGGDLDRVQQRMSRINEDNLDLNAKVQHQRGELADLALDKNKLERECKDLVREKDSLGRRLKMLQEEEAGLRHQTVTEKHEKELIKDHTRLVLRENDKLSEKLTEFDSEINKMQLSHVQEVSLLKKKLELTEAERASLEASVTDIRDRYGVSRRRVEQLAADNVHMISLAEHARTLQDLHSKVNELEVVFLGQLNTANLRVKAVEEERNRMSVVLTEKQAENKRLTMKLEHLNATLSEVQEYVAALEIKVEDLVQGEQGYKSHLSAVIQLAESTMRERQDLAQKLHAQKMFAEEARKKLDRDNALMGKMEKRVKLFKQNMSCKITEQDSEYKSKLRGYERSMNHLRATLEVKDSEMEALMSKNRNTESSLDLLWQQVITENERMKAAALY